MVCQNRRQNRFATRFCLGHNQVCAVPFPRNPLPASPISPVSRCELPVKRAAGAFASKAKKSASLPGAPAAARTRLDRNPHRRCGGLSENDLCDHNVQCDSDKCDCGEGGQYCC